MRNLRKLLYSVICIAVALLLLVYWEKVLGKTNVVVVYFGRPSDIWFYSLHQWYRVLQGSLFSGGVAFVSLIFSGIVAMTFLSIGLVSDGWLRIVERFAAVTQTIPILVIVTVTFIMEKSLIRALGWELGLAWYCFVPVGLALFFPPLVYGVKGVRGIHSNMKALLRIWDAPQAWRIKRIYFPEILPHVLTGLRVSSAWAVAATLITEGLVYGVGGDEYSIGKGLMRPFSGSLAAC